MRVYDICGTRIAQDLPDCACIGAVERVDIKCCQKLRQSSLPSSITPDLRHDWCGRTQDCVGSDRSGKE